MSQPEPDSASATTNRISSAPVTPLKRTEERLPRAPTYTASDHHSSTGTTKPLEDALGACRAIHWSQRTEPGDPDPPQAILRAVP